MSISAVDTLKKYWGHDHFRPLQEDIIESVLSGSDTLALLPTGGGKSICFQVPALMQEGVCVVISPLIALMKDQVENLRKRGIKAVAVYSGMSADEISSALDNCLYGGYKFLYLSPERLLSEVVRDRLAGMKVSLFAVDEAHCISQWGYDFRPPYLQIAQVRDIKPEVPVLALTATATPDVRVDIMNQLHFKKHLVFQKSFERKNLSYLVYHSDDKEKKMTEIFSGIKGSGIVYVRNRKRTKEYAEMLRSKGISAEFYHAGLTVELRSARQDDWKSGKTRVMVCTNAFGMGIDKPDVRCVVHVDLPDNLESYYQEAGRAGRDEKSAFAIVLFNQTDILNLKSRQQTSFPPVSEIKNVYQALANYLQVPVEGGLGVSFDFEITSFISNYNFNPITTLNCIRTLETEGLIAVSDTVFMPSRIHVKVDNLELYNFQVTHQKYDLLIKTILRTTEGVFDDFIRISEPELATRSKLTYKNVVQMLNFMHQSGVIAYEPRKDKPQLTFTTPREDAKYLVIDEVKYNERKENFIRKSESVISYVTSHHMCRSMMLLAYFGETPETRCGVCDYCREMNKLDLNQIEIEKLTARLTERLKSGPATVSDLVAHSGLYDHEKTLDLISWMVDQEMIQYDKKGMLVIHEQAKQ